VGFFFKSGIFFIIIMVSDAEGIWVWVLSPALGAKGEISQKKMDFTHTRTQKSVSRPFSSHTNPALFSPFLVPPMLLARPAAGMGGGRRNCNANSLLSVIYLPAPTVDYTILPVGVENEAFVVL
jgi:hypothetical protein